MTPILLKSGNISDILPNRLLSPSVKCKRDAVFGVFSVLFSRQVPGLFSAALRPLARKLIRQKKRKVWSRMDASLNRMRTDIVESHCSSSGDIQPP